MPQQAHCWLVGRVYRQHLTTSPCLLVFELAATNNPDLISNDSALFARTLRPAWSCHMLAAFKSSMTIIVVLLIVVVTLSRRVDQPLDLGFCFFRLLNFTFCSTGVGALP